MNKTPPSLFRLSLFAFKNELEGGGCRKGAKIDEVCKNFFLPVKLKKAFNDRRCEFKLYHAWQTQ